MRYTNKIISDKLTPYPILIDFSLSVQFSELVVPRHEGVHGPGGREHGREAVVERSEQDVHVVHFNVIAIGWQDAAAIIVRR